MSYISFNKKMSKRIKNSFVKTHCLFKTRIKKYKKKLGLRGLIQIALFKLTSSFSSGAWLCVGIKVDGESDILSKNVIKRDTAGECRPAGYSRTKPEANDNNKTNAQRNFTKGLIS
jgi:hypothetical protein